MANILIIEDEKAIRNVLRNIIAEENNSFSVDDAEHGKAGLDLMAEKSYDLVLCDIKMPGMDGIEVLDKIMSLYPDTAVVMISGHGDIETAVDCIKKGAYDFISKPPDLNRLLNTVRNALDRTQLATEVKVLKKKVSKKYEMIGDSGSLSEVKDMIEKVAPTEARVLIMGPNGSGKELVAHHLHEKSERSKAPMIEVNCAAIPSELIESELFGHKKGAFTSAVKDRKGKFELADGGTLFLDEIGDMSLSAQAKVLRALQESKITPVGGDKEIKVNVRVLAATNKDLQKEIADGKFREDLYHRLSVIVIRVPGLNDRKEDIPQLAEHFGEKISEEQGIAPKKINADAIKALQAFDWTGNIREFRNVMERLYILCGPEITGTDVEQYARK
ncbi:MAG: sigma-54-dependent Fis family transcriptional regulator [Bacteroidetes bacterium]|uniref:Sigma-54-dependent Fis family transcriptional regulator n=1 Tax=Phaeocystidibacter marisrubri TaxID=1577780 RepID=A0A6L3ZHF2_9FLAO|nr:sigma-54 dependent transcriptional regulator [Phaeocystidibacter marisrubri]KAB2817063.1 sigma-54-dependent Fis family transcriptional regulator [Phaeocystidibacter marisrubri]TNE29004.1 MAG: sigma-54-dependent Fis family transcriptional regulator [Bacteroidota bacterium]